MCASGSTCIGQGWAGQMLSGEPEPKRMPRGGMILRMFCEVTKTAVRLTGDVGLTQLPGRVLTLAMCECSTKSPTTGDQLDLWLCLSKWDQTLMFSTTFCLFSFFSGVFLLLFPCCGVLAGVGGVLQMQIPKQTQDQLPHVKG